MNELQDQIKHEVEVLHEFFVAWFSGTAAKKDLNTMLVPRIPSTMLFIEPDGQLITGTDLLSSFRPAHGSNPRFRIAIRDVQVIHETPDHVLVSYTEWQTGAIGSTNSRNGRISTALLARTHPFQWLHLQETWLPKDVQVRADYGF